MYKSDRDQNTISITGIIAIEWCINRFYRLENPFLSAQNISNNNNNDYDYDNLIASGKGRIIIL